jgi:hypothetical protein
MTKNASTLATIEENLDLYFAQKAPPLPDNIKELLVKIAPWATLVLLIIALPFVLFALGLGALAAPFAFLAGPTAGVSYGLTYTLSALVIAVSIVFEAMSIPGLFARSAQGWRYAYYATLVSVVGNIIGLNLASAIIGGLIGFYFLFQIKSYYGGEKRPETAKV